MTGGFKIYIDIFDVSSDPNFINDKSSCESFKENPLPLNSSIVASTDCHQIPKSESQSKCQSVQAVGIDTAKQLNGYLKVHKLNDLVKSRKRWFVFVQDTCRLLYFRQAKDIIPRCSIDIANASFSFCGDQNQSTIHNSIFQIRFVKR